MDIEKLRQKNILQTKKKIKESVSYDQLIINSISTIEELDKIINSLSMRLRDWILLTNPELESKTSDHIKLAKKILELEFKETEMGAKLTIKDETRIKELASSILNLEQLQRNQEKYLREIQEQHTPNIQDLAGTMICAKLLREAKSLKKLAMLQSSTIQLLGAEKALFRHLRTKARPPKHGFIVNHEVVQNSKDKGKSSRALADKISICSRLDYFKGERLGQKYLEELTQKWKK